MEKCCALLFLCGAVFGLSEAGMMTTMNITEQLTNSFRGSFVFLNTIEVYNGWQVKVTFSKPVDGMEGVYGANISSSSSDQTAFILVNTDASPVLNSSTTLKIDIFANYTGTLPTATGKLTNLGVDNCVPSPALPNTDGSKYNFNELLQKSILFYEAQRSGKLPPTNRIPWRWDSALGDHGDNGEDLSGGWFDAGDHVKFNFPQAYTVTTLAWSVLEFKDAYVAAGQMDLMYDCLKWPLDYLVKCHTAKNEFYAQIGDASLDHPFWGRPENMTMPRPAFKINETRPGSDLAAEAAAAFASSSLVFADINKTYSDELLRHAKELYAFALAYPGKFSDNAEMASGYGSVAMEDEMCWGGAWLYMVTNDNQYLQAAEAHYTSGPAWGQNWDEKRTGCMLLLYNMTGKSAYLKDLETTFNNWLPNGTLPYTPKGLVFRGKWGSARLASTMASVALIAAQHGIHPDLYRKWAESQINYILGDSGRSLVVGFGNNPPTHPHHRASSCPFYPAPCTMTNLDVSLPNPHTLYGGLVGGPGPNDEYIDVRTDYVTNEVALDYNAGFQSAIAGLKSLYMQNSMSTN